MKEQIQFTEYGYRLMVDLSQRLSHRPAPIDFSTLQKARTCRSKYMDMLLLGDGDSSEASNLQFSASVLEKRLEDQLLEWPIFKRLASHRGYCSFDLDRMLLIGFRGFRDMSYGRATMEFMVEQVVLDGYESVFVDEMRFTDKSPSAEDLMLVGDSVTGYVYHSSLDFWELNSDSLFYLEDLDDVSENAA